MPDASPQHPQDDIDTRRLTPAQRTRRARIISTLFVIALCGVCGFAGYMAGRGQHAPRREKIVEPEPRKPIAATTPRPTPPPPPLARLESVEATLQDTQVQVRFSTPVEKETADKTGAYAIEPAIMVIAARLAGDGRTVALTTSALKLGTDYRLRIAGIEMLPPTPEDRQATFRYLDTRRVRQGLAALYDFEEGEGEVVRDVSRTGQPLDLRIPEPQKVRWLPGGLAISESTLVAGEGDAEKLIDACRASNAITIEAWLKPGNTSQRGPSRIITLSRGANTRNFTFGQEGPNYNIRLRTTERSENGEPSVTSKGGVVEKLTHVAYTRNVDGKVAVWIDGELNVTAMVDGDLSNWAAFPLGLANEFDTPRTWLGELHLVALYARALTPDEIDQNWKAGPEGKTPRREGAE